MKSLEIVIVTYNWPPRNAIGTHRPYAWARYWSEAGAKVTVVTSKKLAFDEPLDMALPNLEGVTVLSIPYGGVSKGLSDILLKFQFLRNQARKFNAWLGRNTGRRHDPRLAWHAAARDVVTQLAAKSDVVVSTYGPSAAHLIGCEMKKANPSLFWVADYRDLWSQHHRAELTERQREDLREIELATVGHYADSISVVSEDMVEQLGEMLATAVWMIPNGFDIDLALVRERLQAPVLKPNGALRIVYTGTIYKGHQDPVPLLNALVNLGRRGELIGKNVTVDFYGARVGAAQELAQDPKYAPFIRIMGHVSRQEALVAQRNAGLLLLLESSDPSGAWILPGKMFEYIAAGRPILCIGSRRDFQIGKVLSTTGTGVIFMQKEQVELEAALLQTLSGAGIYDSYRPDFEQVFQFSRKRTSEEFLKLLRAASINR